jgi:hypothetical protein
MQQPIKERIAKLRQEIEELHEANRLYVERGSKAAVPAADHERKDCRKFWTN